MKTASRILSAVARPLLLPLLLVLLACSKTPIIANSPSASATKTPLVSQLEILTLGSAPAAGQALAGAKINVALERGNGPLAMSATTPSASPMLSAHVTLNKSRLFDRAFLYGSDLQYSSIHDDDVSINRQAESAGHTLAFFRRLDDHLQLVADQHNQFASDVNHPERLINQFSIIAETDTTLTIDLDHASPVLNTVLTDAKAPAPRNSWVRSVQYVSDGDYVLFETSLEMPDGSIAEFMETFFPRETVSHPGDQALYNDAAVEPLADRFRFLDSGDVYVDIKGKGRTHTKVASRFRRPSASQTIDWYVTPNAPEDYLPAIRDGVEGWNRYAQKMWGTDIIRFKGRLPDGVHIGDPRYNVINWDSVTDAEAAYETQAADPLTGIQTHAMVYLPQAWVQIGIDYWKKGAPSDDPATASAKHAAHVASVKNASFLGRPLPVECLRDTRNNVALEARHNPETFAKALLRGVLFHEIGHSLGLAHNFKGSLSFGPSDDKNAFSTSIMDYNQYQIERAAFADEVGSQGPLLEYDRQIISALYNNAAEITATTPKVPVCADAEADSQDDGIDPLCVRYDAGHDPTEELSLTWHLVDDRKAKLHGTQSLASAIDELASEFGNAAEITTAAQAKDFVDARTRDLQGIVGFYYGSGAQSIASSLKINLGSLREFRDGVLPDGYVENDMHARVLSATQRVSNLIAFTPVTEQALAHYTQAMADWFATTPYVIGAGASVAQDLRTAFEKSNLTFETTLTAKIRKTLYAGLKASAKAPFALIAQPDGSTQDLEQVIGKLVLQAATEPTVGNQARTLEERIEAAKTLGSFALTANGAALLGSAENLLEAETRTAHTVQSRSQAIKVAQALASAKATALKAAQN